MLMAPVPDMGPVVKAMLARRRAAIAAVARRLGLRAPPDGEGERLAALRRAAVPPDRCGPEMPAAPARGALVAVVPQAMAPDGRGGWVLQHAGFRGRDAARARDQWDRMADQARRAGGDPAFAPGQVATARAYAALVERHAAAGLRGASAEVQAGRVPGGGGGFLDAVLDEGRLIARIVAAIGPGLALPVRRGGGARSGITRRALVDQVCVEGLTLSGVLARHGWASCGDLRAALAAELGAALDRMAGVAPASGGLYT